MTDEQREMVAKIYAMQLKGLMFHFDMALMYRLFCNKKMSQLHYKQAMEETTVHTMTEYAMIDKYGEIVKPEVDSTRIRITNALIRTKPANDEIESLHKKAMQAWKEWEQSVLQEYEKAAALFPDVIWQKLIAKVQKEMKRIK